LILVGEQDVCFSYTSYIESSGLSKEAIDYVGERDVPLGARFEDEAYHYDNDTIMSADLLLYLYGPIP